MPKLNPNEVQISAAINGTTRAVYSISKHTGLYLAATGNGAASWRIKYRPRGSKHQRWHTITSDARAIKFRDVAEKAREMLTALRVEGIDPKAESLRPAGLTFDALFRQWLELHAKVKKKSWPHDEALYNRHVAQRIGSKPVTEISRRDVIAVLGDIADKISGIQANRCHSLVSAVFSWAVSMEIAAAHPAMKIPKFGVEMVRERVWTHDELRRLWNALAAILNGTATGPISQPMARIVQLLVLTGQRRAEVAQAGASEMVGGVWSIPARRMKGGEAHAIPLAPMAAAIIADAMRDSANGYLFPGRGGNILDPHSVTTAIVRLTASLGIEGATVHDIRRTVASELARLGVAESIISRLLAHTQGGITARVYNQHSYLAEKRAALALWEAELQRIAAD